MGFKERLGEIYDLDLKENEPMKKHTSIGCGGNARWYTEVISLYSLNRAVQAAKSCRIPVKVIGCGSNLLVSDGGFNGLIISTIKLKDVFKKREGITAMCGAHIADVCTFARNCGLTGLEWAVGIPGTVGGAIVQNAGAFGSCMGDAVASVEALKNGKLVKYYPNDCKFSYRKSKFKSNGETVISATFTLGSADRAQVFEKTESYLLKRRQIQPVGKSCGSVFLNPKGNYAAKLIEQAGLKGYSIGGAAVSEKHANFITASTFATSGDVYALIQYVKKKVKDKFSICLQEEVEFIGEF